MSLKIKLEEELDDELMELKKLEVGSDKYKVAVDGVSKLSDRIITIQSNEAAEVERREAAAKTAELQEKQLRIDKKDRMVKNLITVGTFVGSVAVYGVAYLLSMGFEKEGVFPTMDVTKDSLRNLMKLKKGA